MCSYLSSFVIFFVGSSSASTADVMVESPAQIMFSVGDAPVGSPMMRCTSDFDIVDDSDQEGIEEFDIFIMSPTDCLGNPSFAQVNIQDNDNGVLPSLFCYSRNKPFCLPACSTQNYSTTKTFFFVFMFGYFFLVCVLCVYN